MLPSDPLSRAMSEPSGLAPAAPAGNEATGSGVSWAAVLAGAVVVAGLSLILLALGAGLGLSALSPWSSGASAKAVGAAAIVWLIAAQVLASAMGGYLAGRLRTKWTRIHGDEVYFRDTAHGLLAWATSVVVTAAFLTSAATSLAGGRASRGEGLSSAVGVGSESRIDAADTGPGVYFVDALFRSEQPNSQRSDASIRGEAGRLLAVALGDGALQPSDRTYLGSLIAAKTGLSQSDGERRASEVFTQMQDAVDRARKIAAHLSLWMFLALLAGAFCASYAATIGGRQRDRVVTV
ncbi:MAG: hypothetical protein ACRDPA_04885 [Solirubrobacteraceae bacterium]